MNQTATDQWENVSQFDNIVKFDEAGQTTEGKFIGTFEHTSKKGITFKVHEIENPAGVKEQIFGSGLLDSLLEKVSQGEEIRIEYKGTIPLETDFGLKDVHQWKVLRKKN